ncbi:hypothetical protein CFN78_00535 [Amycolatopsis antarctica]|uniref:DUF4064 domain-containing protein n=2 Tax=Amycolatopsis antarctica TaxID=1854586 RepID=A0A263DCN2_9PSEU|nr:hypothetical protein CFN78_00535 [Amycolatopsis antarctica]
MPAPPPLSASADRPSGPPPKLVNISFGLWIAAGIVLVVGFVVTLAGKQQVIDELIRVNQDDRITNEQIASGTSALLWTLLFGAVVFAVLFALFAYKARDGARKARTILTVLFAITFVFQLLLFSTLVTLFAMLLAAVALVLLYLPSVSSHFPKAPRPL